MWEHYKLYHGSSNCCETQNKGMKINFTNTNRVRNLKFATYLKFATCKNTNKIYELW